MASSDPQILPGPSLKSGGSQFPIHPADCTACIVEDNINISSVCGAEKI